VFLYCLRKQRRISRVALDEDDAGRYGLAEAGGQIVINDRCVAAVDEAMGNGTADVARAANEQNAQIADPSWIGRCGSKRRERSIAPGPFALGFAQIPLRWFGKADL
jgi:hypothetical protein